MLHPFTVRRLSPISLAPASRFELYTIKSVVDGASSKQVSYACIWIHPNPSLDLVMVFFQHMCVTGALEGHKKKEKLKQTSYDMLTRAGTFRACAIFTDTTLRSPEAALGLQGTVCCSEHERKDVIFQFYSLVKWAFKYTQNWMCCTPTGTEEARKCINSHERGIHYFHTYSKPDVLWPKLV